MPTFNEIVREIAHKLETRYRDPTLREQTAGWILENITGKKKIDLIATGAIKLTSNDQQQLEQWIDKIVNQHMPLAYLIGSVPFNGLEILLQQPVLIPRPETEEWVINLIKQLQQLENQKLTILDIGTGSGCVALALAKALPQAIVCGTDISDTALELAQKNAQHNNISNAKFFKSDIFNSVSKEQTFDLIVANPPYIAQDEWQALDPSVKQWEDKHALLAQEEGLALVKKIIDQARAHLKPNNEFELQNIPNLVIEIGYRQGPAVQKLLLNADYQAVEIVKDLEGKDRTAQAQG